MAKVAFIGLGVMGFSMAGHLATKGGHEVRVYNRTRAKADAWAKTFPGTVCETPKEAAIDCDFVFTCVGNDDDLRAVTTGPEGAFHSLKEGAIFIDNTTASADVARELANAAQARGCGFIDAPISGGQAGAESGALTVMCGGDQAVFDKAKPIIDCYARYVGLIGPTGAGQQCKMVNQICIVGLVQSLSEGLHFAGKAGLDIDKVIQAIAQGAAGSWQMSNRWETMRDGDFDHGFAVDWMRKDIAICLTEAQRIGARLPVAALVDQFYAEVQAMGGGRWDTSSLITRLDNTDKSVS